MNDLSFTDVMNLVKLVRWSVNEFDLRDNDPNITLHGLSDKELDLLKKIVLSEDEDEQ